MKVFVSGAGNFLGSAVIAELARKGNHVVGLVNSESEGRTVEKLGGKPLIGDLLTSGAWCKEVQTAEKVISLTSPLEGVEKIDTSKMEAYSHKYTEEVTNLIKAAAGGKAKAVIVSFSTQCMGDRQGKWVSDADAVDPIGYCRPMTGSFAAIERVAEDAELPLIEIYPSLVYGNGSWFKRLITAIQNGTARVVAPGDNYLSLIHVEDAATYIALAAEKLDRNESFCLADDRPVMQREFMDFITDLMDRPPLKQVDFKTYSGLFGVLAAEAMSSSTRVQGVKAMDLLGHVPVYRYFDTGIAHTLKTMGIEPRRRALEEAA
jgi:nucleoside-diphosphate-sugar epimerase